MEAKRKYGHSYCSGCGRDWVTSSRFCADCGEFLVVYQPPKCNFCKHFLDNIATNEEHAFCPSCGRARTEALSGQPNLWQRIKRFFILPVWTQNIKGSARTTGPFSFCGHLDIYRHGGMMNMTNMLTPKQKEILIDKLSDMGNLAVASLIFGSMLQSKLLNSYSLFFGFIIGLAAYLYALALAKQ